PYRVPPPHLLAERLEAVLSVLYLIFNEGYAATSGENLIRQELCNEAIHLCRVLGQLMENEPSLNHNPEVLGLLALMLLHNSRRDARLDAAGHLVLLPEQDRARWIQSEISEGEALLEMALRMKSIGPYQLQAAIAAVHAQAHTAEETDWQQIAALYRLLLRLTPSPVIELNWIVAVSMLEGPDRGLLLFQQRHLDETLSSYYLFHATRADFLRRSGSLQDAFAAYQEALQLCQNNAEQIFLQRRLDEVEAELSL
ncbi:MAG TPA: DUF6596 domain-containing protein, partial [Ktedonobacteraceae bacterium]|nr:DUF6596 domain-containing protein [Ktedonobacteraceae bacterium]